MPGSTDRRKDAQDLRIATIIAGLNYKAAYEEAVNLVRRFEGQYKQAQDLNILIVQLLIDITTPFPTERQDAITLITEYEWYRTHGKDNTRRAIKQSNKRRRDQGLLPISTPRRTRAEALSALTRSGPQPEPPPQELTPEELAYQEFNKGLQGDPGANISTAEKPADYFLKLAEQSKDMFASRIKKEE